MKVTDLMVGDWVICNHYQDKPFTKQFGVADFAKGEYEFCEPIPLTEEILDDNNFFQDHKYFTFGITKETRIVLKRINEEDNKWYAGVITVFDEIGHAYVHHIHQLQHLLRLCGIEKEIEL